MSNASSGAFVPEVCTGCFAPGPFVDASAAPVAVVIEQGTSALIPSRTAANPLTFLIPDTQNYASDPCLVDHPTARGQVAYRNLTGAETANVDGATGNITAQSAGPGSVEVVWTFDTPVNFRVGLASFDQAAGEVATFITPVSSFVAGAGSSLATAPGGYPTNTVFGNGNSLAQSFATYTNVTEVIIRTNNGTGFISQLNPVITGYRNGYVAGPCGEDETECCPITLGEVCHNGPGRAFALYDPETQVTTFIDMVTGASVPPANIIACTEDTAPTNVNGVIARTLATAAGNVVAGKWSATFVNVGTTNDPTVAGVILNVGESVTFTGYFDQVTRQAKRLPAIAYVGTATGILHIATQD